jgi:hypothetical protein
MEPHAWSISKEFHLDLRALLSGDSTASDQTTAAGNETVSWEVEAALVEDARQDPAAFAYLYETILCSRLSLSAYAGRT